MQRRAIARHLRTSAFAGGTGRWALLFVLISALTLSTGWVGLQGVHSPSPMAGPGVSGTLGLQPAASPTFPTGIRHVVIVLMENENLATVLQQGPFEKHLAQKYGFASNYYAVCHPSAPNYLSITSGKSWQCGSDSYNVYTTKDMATLVGNAGLTWGAYDESMPSACDTSNTALYAVRHNPFVYYSDVVNNKTLCNSHDVNSKYFNQSAANNTLPNLSFYTPNTKDDGHDTNVSFADKWLKGWLSPLLNDSVFSNSVFFIVYDEGSGSNTGYNGTAGGKVYFTAVSPDVKANYTLTNNTSHYNLLTTTEWLLGLGSTGHNDSFSAWPPMKTMFTTSSGPPQYALTGTVTSSATGLGISGATVRVTGGASTTTSSSGAYSLDLLNGTYTVTASAAGFTASSSSVTIAGGAKTQNFALAVNTVLYLLSGTVTNATGGAPIAGAQVSVAGGSTLTTNSSGGYSAQLTNGTYSLSASAAGYHSANASVSVVGGALVQNFALAPLITALYQVSGLVTNASSGAPLGTAQVAVAGGATVTSNSSGGYATQLADGTYTLTATAPGYQSGQASVTVSGAAVVQNFALTPTPSSTYQLTGKVTSADTGAALSGARVDLGFTWTTSGPFGHYTFTLPNGDYTLKVSLAGYHTQHVHVTVNGAAVVQNVALNEFKFALSGTVTTTPSDAALVGANVSVSGTAWQLTNSTGGYDIPLANGSYFVTVAATGLSPAQLNITIFGAPVVANVAMAAPGSPGGGNGNGNGNGNGSGVGGGGSPWGGLGWTTVVTLFTMPDLIIVVGVALGTSIGTLAAVAISYRGSRRNPAYSRYR